MSLRSALTLTALYTARTATLPPYTDLPQCQGSLSRTGSWTRSPQRGSESGESSPHGSSSRCSTSNMTTASTQRTEAMPTKDALFGRKKKDIRVFPDFTGGSESVPSRGVTKNGYSVFDEVSYRACRILYDVSRISHGIHRIFILCVLVLQFINQMSQEPPCLILPY